MLTRGALAARSALRKEGTSDLFSLFDFACFHRNAPYHASETRGLRMPSLETILRKKSTIKGIGRRSQTWISAQMRRRTHVRCMRVSSLCVSTQDLLGSRAFAFIRVWLRGFDVWYHRQGEWPAASGECGGSAPSRKPKTVDEARIMQLYEDTYGRFDFTPTHSGSDAAVDRQDGCFS